MENADGAEMAKQMLKWEELMNPGNGNLPIGHLPGRKIQRGADREIGVPGWNEATGKTRPKLAEP